MTGSKRAFTYVSDAGTEYIVQLDESVYESDDLGFTQTVSAALAASGRYLAATATIPLEMRKINCVELLAGNAFGPTRTFWVGGTGAPAWGNASSCSVGGRTYQITSKIGERRRLIPLVDTGQTDGDSDIVTTGP